MARWFNTTHGRNYLKRDSPGFLSLHGLVFLVDSPAIWPEDADALKCTCPFVAFVSLVAFKSSFPNSSQLISPTLTDSDGFTPRGGSTKAVSWAWSNSSERYPAASSPSVLELDSKIEK